MGVNLSDRSHSEDWDDAKGEEENTVGGLDVGGEEEISGFIIFKLCEVVFEFWEDGFESGS